MKIRIRLEKRDKSPSYLKVVLPIASVLIAFVIIAFVLLAMGYDPIKCYRYLIRGAFGSPYNISETVLQSIPLMLASLGVAVALNMNVMNIGAEGQFAIGAWAAIGVGVYCTWLPTWAVLPCMVLAGVVLGALWGVIAVFPRIKWGVNETITTLMFNYIALQWNDYFIFGPWRDQTSLNLPISPTLPSYGMFPTFLGTRVHLGLVIGLIAAVILYVFIKKSAVGFQVRVAGRSSRAAHYAGIKVSGIMFLVMCLSGGLAGLAGVTMVGGAGTRLITNVAGGAGYTALVISRLAKNNPLTIILVSLLFGGLTQGCYALQMAQIPSQMSDLLQGAILMCALGGDLFIDHTLKICIMRDQVQTEKGGAV